MNDSGTDVFSIERPHPKLFNYYALSSLLLGPFFFVYLIPMYFRYHTLRYRFDDEGVAMRWGILFRKEISLTYARIQDIHLSSNLIERWLGLAKVEVQTASGSADAEMTIEGLMEFQAVRDFLYSRMRGARAEGQRPAAARTVGAASGRTAVAASDELADALRALAEEARAIRRLLEERTGGAGGA